MVALKAVRRSYGGSKPSGLYQRSCRANKGTLTSGVYAAVERSLPALNVCIRVRTFRPEAVTQASSPGPLCSFTHSPLSEARHPSTAHLPSKCVHADSCIWYNTAERLGASVCCLGTQSLRTLNECIGAYRYHGLYYNVGDLGPTIRSQLAYHHMIRSGERIGPRFQTVSILRRSSCPCAA